MQLMGSQRPPSGSLGPLVECLPRSSSEIELMAVVLKQLPRLAGAHGASITLWSGSETRYQCTGFDHQLMSEWLHRWRAQDQVYDAVITLHTPVQNWAVYSQSAWVTSEVYLGLFRHIGAYHYLSLPLYGSEGSTAGLINLYRKRLEPRFDDCTVTTASVIAGYCSVMLVRLAGLGENLSSRLTPRELQAARLAALGRNNLQIADSLGIARDTVKKSLGRVYEKLEVSGRAEMASRLTRAGIL